MAEALNRVPAPPDGDPSAALNGIPAKHEFAFYGASRFERPEIGCVFRRDGRRYRVDAITHAERNYLRPFDRVWEFRAECTRLDH